MTLTIELTTTGDEWDAVNPIGWLFCLSPPPTNPMEWTGEVINICIEGVSPWFLWMSISSVQDNMRIRLDWTAFPPFLCPVCDWVLEFNWICCPKISRDFSSFHCGKDIPLSYFVYVPSWPAPANPLRNPAAPRFRWFHYCPAVDDSRRERTSGWWNTSIIGLVDVCYTKPSDSSHHHWEHWWRGKFIVWYLPDRKARTLSRCHPWSILRLPGQTNADRKRRREQ